MAFDISFQTYIYVLHKYMHLHFFVQVTTTNLVCTIYQLHIHIILKSNLHYIDAGDQACCLIQPKALCVHCCGMTGLDEP